MNTQLTTLISSLVIGFIGGFSSQYFVDHGESPVMSSALVTEKDNPFTLQNEPENELVSSEPKIAEMQLRITQLEEKLYQLEQQASAKPEQPDNQESISKTPRMQSATPTIDNLVDAGINQHTASEILRRMSEQDFRRLQLQNLIRRSNGEDRRAYRNELRELNRNRISLRSELGDPQYDRYLFTSGQNNRVQVSSVMSGSPAETSGFETGDVIVGYDNQQILNWPDIRKATAQGEIGSYTNVEIIRNGEQMTLMVPRGTLGVQLEAIQLDPDS